MVTRMRIAVAVLFLAATAQGAYAAVLKADSRITQVAVYPDGASITRAATVKVDAGSSAVVFSDIIPEVDEQSLRVSGKGSAEVKILGAQVKREYLEERPSERVRALESEIQKLQDSRLALEDAKKVLQEKRKFLDSIHLFSETQLPKDLVTKVPSAQELDATYTFLDSKFREQYTQTQETDIKIRELDKKIQALQEELGEIAGSTSKLKRSITVDIEAAKPATLELTVSYLVQPANWYPVYDARVAFERSEVELVSFGIIKQSTGEPWNEVKVSLSTARPSVSGRMPYIEPWFVRPIQYKRAEMLMARKAATPTMSMQYQAMDEMGGKGDPEENKPLAEAKNTYAEVTQQGISVSYTIARAATVNADGSEQKIPISAQTLKAAFEYSAYPRLSPFAYLGSRVSNVKDLQLLAGRVNVFLDGDFAGTSSIDTLGPGEEFDLYLGIDESVKVKREIVHRKVDDVLIAGIPSPTRKVTTKCKLTVENYKTKPIKVNLFEAMPVSEDERIKVRVSDVSVEPKDKDWKDRKGVWRWDLSLAPGAKQEIFYTWTVEHPRDMQVEGL